MNLDHIATRAGRPMFSVLRLITSRAWGTMGQMFAPGGDLIAYTLEDFVHDGPKVPGETAVPAGIYGLTINFSPRFKVAMPLLTETEKVGFAGVRIHTGNDKSHTEGCILVGTSFSHETRRLVDSQKAYGRVFERISYAIEQSGGASIRLFNGFGQAEVSGNLFNPTED
jgi:hypothetical protein